MTLPMVILAGGLATRLGDLSIHTPKSLIPIFGRPFIEWQIENMKDSGVSDFLICIGHLGEQISDYLGNGEKLGVNIEYSSDGPSPLGTGGAIIAAINRLPDYFMITYGDSYLPTNFNKIENHFFQLTTNALMTVYNNKEERERSNCYYRDGMVKKYSKRYFSQEMNYVDYGLTVVNKSVFDSISSQIKFDLSDTFEELSVKTDLPGYEILDRYYEIGSIQGIRELENYLVKTGRN
jgi:N-acetyl-alpha-D-muramate 1-phosphate uridylyltransferase